MKAGRGLRRKLGGVSISELADQSEKKNHKISSIWQAQVAWGKAVKNRFEIVLKKTERLTCGLIRP